jgi:peptide/nickel transport system substrate-binding protein
MQEHRSSYWESWRRRRLSRRRLLASALAAGTGAAALALTGCTAEEEEGTPTPGPDLATPALVPVVTRGGGYRNFSYDAMAVDTLDPHQTQFGPLYSMHASVFSKVLQYDDEIEQIMRADLSAGLDGGPGLPEQPDEQTYIIKIRPNVYFHDTDNIRKNFPNVAGRQLTAEDVKYSIERQVNPQSPQRALYYRSFHWETVEKIELLDKLSLSITTKGPIAPFLHYLADRNAFIVAKELVDENDEMNHQDRMIGTGPFILDKFETQQTVKVVRNPAWFGTNDRLELGTGRPFLDSRETMWTPQSASVAEAAFRKKQIDSASSGTDFNNLATLLRMAEAAGDTFISQDPQGGGVQSRLLIDRPPFDDSRRRRAIYLAIDRHIIGEALYPAPPSRTHFLLSGPIAWPMRRWAIPQEELAKKPGYRFGTAEREEDLAEAKKLWEAAGGTEAAGTLKIMYPGQPTYIPEKGIPLTVRMLTDMLGAKVQTEMVQTEMDPTGYTTLAQCMVHNTQGTATGTCEFVWGFDNGLIDLDDWLYPYFHSRGSKNSFGLSDPRIDDLIEAQRVELDDEKRYQLGLDIQHYLMDQVNCRIEYVNQLVHNLNWSYVKNPFQSTWYGMTYMFANTWLDQNAPSYSGRPA